MLNTVSVSISLFIIVTPIDIIIDINGYAIFKPNLMIVQCQYLAFKQKSPRTRKSSGFRNLLWEFKFTEIDLKVSQITQDDNINPLHKEGFENF